MKIKRFSFEAVTVVAPRNKNYFNKFPCFLEEIVILAWLIQIFANIKQKKYKQFNTKSQKYIGTYKSSSFLWDCVMKLFSYFFLNENENGGLIMSFRIHKLIGYHTRIPSQRRIPETFN